MKSKNGYAVSVPLVFLAGIHVACGDTTWPIEPVDSDHPVGNTMGEFIVGEGGGYQHEGIDILGTPYDQSTEMSPAPYVIVTVAGKVEAVQMNPDDRDNYIMIKSMDGRRRFVYAHLEASTIPIPLKLKINGTNLNLPNAWPELEEGRRSHS